MLLSYISNNNEVFRFDSNYFKKEFLVDENLIRSKSHKTLKEINASLLSFGAYSLNNYVNYQKEGVPFIRGINMKNGRINFSDITYINEDANSLLWKSEVKPETVLLSMSGTIGDVAIASKTWEYPINSNQDIAKINTQGKLNPYILFAFLLSKFGQNYLKREARGSVQQHVFLSQMENFEIPLFSNKFEKKIQKIIEESDNKLEYSENNYTQAENLLLKELDLENFEPEQEATNVKSFSASFGTSGRLDAEYYQKKYEQVLNKIKTKPYDSLKNVVNITKSIEPGSKHYAEEGVPFVRVADYSKQGLTPPAKFLSQEFYSENKTLLDNLKPKKASILFSKDGSVGNAYTLKEDAEFITSGAILHLTIKNSKKVIPEYLTLVLNSDLVQLQAERDAGGSIILHWRVSEIKEVLVPIIDIVKQQEIAHLIEESFQLKKQSGHLLEVAKKAVEIAIEENEEVAMAYIEENNH